MATSLTPGDDVERRRSAAPVPRPPQPMSADPDRVAARGVRAGGSRGRQRRRQRDGGGRLEEVAPVTRRALFRKLVAVVRGCLDLVGVSFARSRAHRSLDSRASSSTASPSGCPALRRARTTRKPTNVGVGEPPDALRPLRVAPDPVLVGAAAGGAAQLRRLVVPRAAARDVRDTAAPSGSRTGGPSVPGRDLRVDARLRSGRGTTRRRCRACRAGPTGWASSCRPGCGRVVGVRRDARRSRRASPGRRRRSRPSSCRPGGVLPLRLGRQAGRSCRSSRDSQRQYSIAAWCAMQMAGCRPCRSRTSRRRRAASGRVTASAPAGAAAGDGGVGAGVACANANRSYSSQVTSVARSRSGATATGCCGPSSPARPFSLAGAAHHERAAGDGRPSRT